MLGLDERSVLAAFTRFAWILGRRGVRAANKPLPSDVERCSSGCTRDSRVKGFSNVAEVIGSLTARGAEAWTSGGIRQQSFAIVGHFFRSGGNGLFCSPPELRTCLQKGIWNRTTINLLVRRERRRGSSGGRPIVPQAIAFAAVSSTEVAVVKTKGAKT